MKSLLNLWYNILVVDILETLSSSEEKYMELTPFEKIEKAASDRMIIVSAITVAHTLSQILEDMGNFSVNDADITEQVIVKMAQALEEHFGISA